MDQNENTIPMSISDSRPISPSPVTVAMEAAPVRVKDEETKGGDLLAKKKRGRPRKCDSEGNSIKPSGGPGESSTKRSWRKRKGDPSMSLGGGDFTAHMFTVNAQEDIIERIMSLTQNGSRGICVLSANGAVCNVKIQPLGFNSNILTFKDAYEIVSLSGTMVVTESGGVRNETGRWRITIAGVNGCVFGGYLAGRLIAASPVQVVIGSFWPLIVNPTVIVTPTRPNAMTSTSSGQVHQPETRDTSLCLNKGLNGSGSELNW